MSRHSSLTPQQIDDIVARFKAGESQRSIAASYGAPAPKISRALRGRGYGDIRKNLVTTAKLAEHTVDIVERYNRGDAVNDIAAAYNTNRVTLRAFLAKQGIEPRKTWSRNPKSEGVAGLTDDARAAILRDYVAGATMDALSEKHGISTASIWKWIRVNDLQVRSRGPAQIISKLEQRVRRYGLTVATHDAILAAQSGVCAICGCVPTAARNKNNKNGQLCVDHDHRTGAVRGLLCQSCNSALGYADDDPVILRAAVAYLAKHAVQAPAASIDDVAATATV